MKQIKKIKRANKKQVTTPKKKALKKSLKKKGLSKKKENPPEYLLEIHRVLLDMKSEGIVVLDLRDKASYTDYMVVASASNTRQALAIADKIEEEISKKFKRKPLGREGFETAQWILLDYGDCVCHIFLNETRQFYRLEDLWHDAIPLVMKARNSTKLKPKKKYAAR